MTFYVAFSIGFTKWLCCVCWPFSNRLFTGQLKKSPSLSLTVRKKKEIDQNVPPSFCKELVGFMEVVC